MRPPIFGVNLSTSAAPGGDPVADARLAEDLGFDFVSSSDHPCADDVHETWTMLTWVAASTTRIRVATRVLGTPFRNDVLLGKMAATLERLSGGRLVLGLGGGASNDEIAALGLPALSDGEKITGLASAVDVVRRHTTVPVWLGTFGPRGLALTGRVADGWIPSLGYAPDDRLPDMLARVRGAAQEAGRAPDAVACVLNMEVEVDGRAAATGLVDRLRRFRDTGFDGFNFIVVGDGVADQQRRIAAHVLPALRQV